MPWFFQEFSDGKASKKTPFKVWSEARHDRDMAASDEWINDMWVAYRINLGRETSNGWVSKEGHSAAGWPCEGFRHGGGWDRFVWRGDTRKTERAYCIDCGKYAAHCQSPWAIASYEAWKRTKYMKDAERQRWAEETKREIKFDSRGGRRVIIFHKAAKNSDVVNFLVDRGYGNAKWFRS